MPLHLITGPAASGKSRLVHEPLEAAAARGERAVLVVPTAADARRTASVFAARGVLGLGFTTFDRLIENLWFEHGDGRALATPVLRELLMSQAVGESSLALLAASARTPGFVRLMAGIAARATGPVPQERSSGQPAEIALVIAHYQQILQGHDLIEPAQAAALLADTRGVTSGVAGVSGFIDLSEHQESLLLGLAREADVYLALSWQEGLPASEGMDALVQRLAERCDSHQVMEGRGADRELDHVAARLFEPSDPPLESTGAVQLAEAEGPEAECARVAEMVKRWVVEEGIAPERIAVGFRRLESRAPYIQAAMESLGLVTAIDCTAPFRLTPLGAAALALLDTAAGVGGRERLLAFVQSPFSGIEAQEACELDATWRQRRETRPAALLESLRGAGPTAACAVDAARHVVEHSLDSECVRNWQSLADTLMRAGSSVRPFGSPSSLEDAAAHRALLDAVSQIARVRPVATFADVVAAVQDSTVAPGVAERPGAVLVTEVHRLRGRRFEGVVIGGLTSGEFSSERQDPLIATILPRLGMAPGVPERLSERMLFHTLVTRASRRLGLVRQTVDAAGLPVRASVFWEEMLDLYRPLGSSEDELTDAPMGLIVSAGSTKALLESAPVFSSGREDLRATVAKGGAVWRPSLGEANSALLEELSAAARFRVTEIEAYASCPYRWFWSEKLMTRPLDAEVGAAERGALAHKILAEFYRGEFPALRVARMGTEVLEEAIHRVRKSAKATVDAMRTPICGLEEELTVASCQAWAEAVVTDDIEWLPGFVPAGTEVVIGEDQPFVFGGVSMHGRFDRADVSADGVVVTDYKSSKTLTGADKLVESGLIQVIAYAQAASELYGRPVAGGLYRSLQSLQARGFVVEGLCDPPHTGNAKDTVSTEGFAALREAAEELVSQCVEGIRAGRIAPNPATDRACSYCGASAFCPKAKVSTW